jgi:hypothetical protein
MEVQHVGLLGARHRLTGEALGFVVLTATRQHAGVHLAPEHLRRRLIARGGREPFL